MPTPETAPQDNEENALSKEEIAWLIKILWPALQAPDWKKQSLRDLEKFSEAIRSGKSLKELDDSLYERIFPHLAKVATHLGLALKKSVPSKETSSQPATITPIVPPGDSKEQDGG